MKMNEKVLNIFILDVLRPFDKKNLNQLAPPIYPNLYMYMYILFFTCDMWHLTHDTVTCDIWNMADGIKVLALKV